MRTQFESNEPIEAYLAVAGKYLRQRLSASVADQRLAEARTHLSERSEELISGGMSVEQAQTTAVRAFGSAKEWARSIAEAAYIDPMAVVAGRIAATAAIFGVLLSFAEMVIQTFRPLNPLLLMDLSKDLLAVALCILAISALRARRSRTLLIGVVGGLAAVGAFVYFGSSLISFHGGRWFRSDVVALNSGLQREMTDTRSEIALLTLGMATYSQPSGSIAVPQALRTDTGAYITPVAFPSATITPTRISPGSVPAPEYIETDLQYWIKPSLGDTQPMASAFKTYTPQQIKIYQTSLGNIDLGLRFRQEAPYQAVATVDEARKAWKSSGADWLDIQKVRLKFGVNWLSQTQKMAAQPTLFDWTAGFPFSALILIYTLAALFIDQIAAFVGQFFYRRGWFRIRYSG